MKPSAEMLEAFSLCLHKEKLKVINYKLKVGLARSILSFRTYLAGQEPYLTLDRLGMHTPAGYV